MCANWVRLNLNEPKPSGAMVWVFLTRERRPTVNLLKQQVSNHHDLSVQVCGLDRYIPHFVKAASAFAGSCAILITAFRLIPVAFAIAE